MFQVGDLVVYQSEGVCRVLDIAELDMMREGKKWYYMLSPLKNPAVRIYSPVENPKVLVRSIMTKSEMEIMLCEMADSELFWIDNEKQRESIYKNAVKSIESREWLRMIRTLYQRKKRRMESGKKMTATDERYFKTAKALLYEELAVVLGKEEGEIEDFLVRYFTDRTDK